MCKRTLGGGVDSELSLVGIVQACGLSSTIPPHSSSAPFAGVFPNWSVAQAHQHPAGSSLRGRDQVRPQAGVAGVMLDVVRKNARLMSRKAAVSRAHVPPAAWHDAAPGAI